MQGVVPVMARNTARLSNIVRDGLGAEHQVPIKPNPAILSMIGHIFLKSAGKQCFSQNS